jgi:hypothetical protein
VGKKSHPREFAGMALFCRRQSVWEKSILYLPMCKISKKHKCAGSDQNDSPKVIGDIQK